MDQGSTNMNRHILFTNASLIRLLRVRRQCSHPYITPIDLIHVADATVNHNPSPPIVLSQLTKIATHKCTSHAPSSINH
ncbi:hypothetical protein HanPSC8_Chr11g0464871 [Helianthus annuus]|nr:hypothetical protein HanPSC8_Chr11g0464871 [Helianthus annuus]